MHANVTEAMVRLADAMTVYRTYPHVDMAETGRRAAALLQARLDGRPVHKAFRKLPFLVPLSAQCTEMEPLRSIYAGLPDRETGAVLSVDIASGFPPADIRECGGSVLVYADDQAAADRCADEILATLLEAEDRMTAEVLSVQDAVAQAMARGRPGRPVILADIQDNPGAGATADTTAILAELVRAGARAAALSVLWDPDTAEAAHAAGVGGEIERRLGDRYGYDAEPFAGRFRVEALSDGEILGEGVILDGVGHVARPDGGAEAGRAGRGRADRGLQPPLPVPGPDAVPGSRDRAPRPGDPGGQEHRPLPRRLRADRGRDPDGRGAGRASLPPLAGALSPPAARRPHGRRWPIQRRGRLLGRKLRRRHAQAAEPIGITS